jgi:hypothetical protein
MQPRNPFQGQAPSNMQFPTDAYIRGVTNAANIQAEAQARMGQQLGEGIQKAAGAYKQNADAKSDYNATQAMLKSPTYRKLYGLDEKGATDLSSTIANAQGEGGYAAANKLTESVLKYLFQSNQLAQEMQARANIANAQIAGALDRAKLKEGETATGSGEEDDVNVFMKAIENIRNRRKLGNSQQGNKP